MELETGQFHPDTPAVQWKKVALIGVGLLGGSLGLALRRRRLARSVTGFVRRSASIAECERLGAVHRATRNLDEAVEGADLIVFCTPLAQMRALAEQMLPALAKGATVTDVGSVKGSVAMEIETLLAKGGARFIGSHPMAGSEKTGVAAARADLFAQAVCVVTPTPKSNPAALRKVERLWISVGARVLRMPPALHDRMVSRSSHLPHIVAATLVNSILPPRCPVDQARLCANGFRDSTRIASGSPEMWRDIAMANQKHLTQALDSFIAELSGFRRSLKTGNSRAVFRFLTAAKERRDRWAAKARSASPE